MSTENHAIMIAELKLRVDGHDEALARHEKHLAKLDETVIFLREGLMTVATKNDIAELRKDIGDRFDKRLVDAHNSIPAKFAAVCAGGMFLIAAVTLALNMVRHG